MLELSARVPGEGPLWPERIQQRRTKGWTKPPGAVSVARPHRYGNPHRVEPATGVTAQDAVDRFAADLEGGRLPYTRDDILEDLAGRDLMCFCPTGQPCHADILLAIANPTPGPDH